MKTDDALATLIRHQSEALVIITSATALVEGEPAAVRAPLSKTRWTLIRKLREYQMFKHVEIFDPAIARGTPAQSAAAQRLRANCVALATDFESYIRFWSAQDTVAQWSCYKPAMLAMAARLRGHLEQERIDVTALLAGAERTRHLAS